VTGFNTATPPSRGSRSGSTRRARGGDFYLATSGDRYLATCGDFLMAMDTRPSWAAGAMIGEDAIGGCGPC